MTHLRDIVDLTALSKALTDGYVRRQVHPEYPYAILNYTEKAQFENVWDDVTKNCRGLIYEIDTQEARDHRLGHDARADRGDRAVREG